ncbi:hypothetical protein FB45DRAFT_1029853 [Roridomyces roridus]|uniref:Uncharacterized protein n=1 Tax=Roridomyces roridus TaxID=1738132 RepID=A0AAD7BMP1_9AGAR|nr:hypothetical protein FB45DRAFT_1029853 [Roridomyces roridus]
MHPTLPWPVSPEFEDALALATERHMARTSPETLHPTSLEISSPYTPASPIVPRSGSLMMKTRVAVRDKNPHRFQVVPLRDAAQQNRDKDKLQSNLKPMQPPVPWIRQLAVLRPSGVGLGLTVPVERPATPKTPDRGRDRGPRGGDAFAGQIPRKGILRTLQGGSPRRPLPGSPDRKENRLTVDGNSISSKKRGRRRVYALETFNLDSDTTITPSSYQTTPASIPSEPTLPSLPTAIRLSNTEAPLSSHASTDTIKSATATSRHFKSPSLGAIHHLLSSSTSTTAVGIHDADATVTAAPSPMRINTKRYGVYTPGKLDFGSVSGETEVAMQDDKVEDGITSTFSFGALLVICRGAFNVV